MFRISAGYRWAFGARGGPAILFGLFLFISTDLSFSSFVVATGFLVLLESLLLLYLNYFGVSRQRFLLVIVESGIGARAILTGLCGFFHAAAMRPQTQGSWILVLRSLLALPGGVGLILPRSAGIRYSSVANRLIFNPLRCAACYRHVKSNNGMKRKTHQFREGISG